MEPYQVIDYRGHQINIIADENPQDPQEWENTDCFLIYNHRDFCVQVKGFDAQDIFENGWNEGKTIYDGYWIFPVFALIHSGVSLSLARETFTHGCDPGGWDTSFTGFALVKRQKGWSYTAKQARKIAQSVVDEWNDFLSGNVWGFQVDEDGDSCWGFYGDYDKCGAIEEGKASIDAMIIKEQIAEQARIKRHTAYVKRQIINGLPLIYRKPLQL